MLLRRTVAAARYPISLVQAREHLKEPDALDNAIIQDLIATACDAVAEMAGRTLATETWQASYPVIRGDLVLPKNPVREVVSIGWYDDDDVAQVASLSDFYVFADEDRCILRPKAGKAWPRGIAREDAITVTFTAGYDTAPAALTSAALLMIGHLYEHREAVVTDGTAAVLPMAVAELVSLYRSGWVAG